MPYRKGFSYSKTKRLKKELLLNNKENIEKVNL